MRFRVRLGLELGCIILHGYNFREIINGPILFYKFWRKKTNKIDNELIKCLCNDLLVTVGLQEITPLIHLINQLINHLPVPLKSSVVQLMIRHATHSY